MPEEALTKAEVDGIVSKMNTALREMQTWTDSERAAVAMRNPDNEQGERLRQLSQWVADADRDLARIEELYQD